MQVPVLSFLHSVLPFSCASRMCCWGKTVALVLWRTHVVWLALDIGMYVCGNRGWEGWALYTVGKSLKVPESLKNWASIRSNRGSRAKFIAALFTVDSSQRLSETQVSIGNGCVNRAWWRQREEICHGWTWIILAKWTKVLCFYPKIIPEKQSPWRSSIKWNIELKSCFQMVVWWARPKIN